MAISLEGTPIMSSRRRTFADLEADVVPVCGGNRGILLDSCTDSRIGSRYSPIESTGGGGKCDAIVYFSSIVKKKVPRNDEMGCF